MVNPDHPPKKGRKRWLAAILAAALAVVEVILPHATPLAEAVVTVLDLERQLGGVGEQPQAGQLG